MKVTATRNQGVLVATYCDFTNMGGTSTNNWGVQSQVDATGNPTVTLQNCTSTGGNWNVNINRSDYTGTFVFSNNSFSSSVGITLNTLSSCVGLAFQNASASPGPVAQFNSFDLGVAFQTTKNLTFTDNSCQGGIAGLSTTAWSSDSMMARNLIYNATAVSFTMGGSAKDCYCYMTIANAHYILFQTSVVNATITGLIFENGDGTGLSDCIFPVVTASGTTAVKNCIVLPNAITGASSGKLVSGIGSSGGSYSIVCEHNTYAALNGETACQGLGESSNSHAGEVTSMRANIIWAYSRWRWPRFQFCDQ